MVAVHTQTASSSHITIAQPSTKRQRSTTVDNMADLQNIEESKLNNIPKYLQMPDTVFKKMLTTSLEGMESIVQTLDTKEKIQHIRIYTQLVNNIFYLKLKQEFFKDYYQIVMSEGIWSLQMPKQIVNENNLRRIQFMTQDKLVTHQNALIVKLKQAEEELDRHKQVAVDRSIDIKRFSTVIPAFVRKGQRNLTHDFQRKKLLLQLDVNEHSLVQKFYELKPSEDQV